MIEKFSSWRAIVLFTMAILLVLLVTIFVRQHFDEKKLARVAVGMTVEEVEALLGPADYTERDVQILSSPIHTCFTEAALVYYRTWRDSLFVHLDAGETTVVCVERVGLRHTQVP